MFFLCVDVQTEINFRVIVIHTSKMFRYLIILIYPFMKKLMQKPIQFVCSSCREPILELTATSQSIFNSAGSYCTTCGHLMTKEEIMIQVHDYCLLHFSKSFNKNSHHAVIHVVNHTYKGASIDHQDPLIW
jgi:hypothetical protein